MHYNLIMGNQAYSSWSLRGWLLLRAFEIDFSYDVIPLQTPQFDEFQANNYPALTVPTLQVFDGEIKTLIWDSLAIAEFIHEQHPTVGIWPSDIHARAAARSLCAEMHSSFAALRSEFPVNIRRTYKSISTTAASRADIDRIERLWDWTASRWAGAGPYLFGTNFSAVDAFFTPVASRLHSYNLQIGLDAQRYVEALLQHPATVDFYHAGQTETWVLGDVEFDQK